MYLPYLPYLLLTCLILVSQAQEDEKSQHLIQLQNGVRCLQAMGTLIASVGNACGTLYDILSSLFRNEEQIEIPQPTPESEGSGGNVDDEDEGEEGMEASGLRGLI